MFYCLDGFGGNRKSPTSKGSPPPSPPPTPSAEEQLQAQLIRIGAVRTERGWIVTLLRARCTSWKARLESADADKLERVAGLLEAHSRLRVLIEAHSDNLGTGTDREVLSQNLAYAVLRDLIECGSDAGRVRATVRDEPVFRGSGENAKVRELHRRIHIIFSDADGQFNPATDRAFSGSSRA
jgi:flagellar motor protein MotB